MDLGPGPPALSTANSGRELKRRTNGKSGSPKRLHIRQSQNPLTSSHDAIAADAKQAAISARRPSAWTRNRHPTATPAEKIEEVIFKPAPTPLIAPASAAQPTTTTSGSVSRRRRDRSRIAIENRTGMQTSV